MVSPYSTPGRKAQSIGARGALGEPQMEQFDN
jgi:hypothetical protein